MALRRLISIAAVALAGPACFSPSFDSCAVACGAGGACPDGMTCLGDGICHRSAAEALCAPRPDADPDQPDADPSLPDASLFDAGPPVTPDGEGQLVITEILVDSVRTPEEPHEWFEVHNPSPDVTYDLMGLEIDDGSLDLFDVTVPLLVPPGGYVVFGEDGDTERNGGVTVDFDYPDMDFNLGNGGDLVRIVNPINDAVIDEVDYLGTWQSEGAAMSLDPDSTSSVDNDSSTAWCDAVDPFGDELPEERGTPGAANPDC